MKLISLTCKNFKKLSDFTANFEDGLNVIVGENAQGKSTLLQAIEAALFGVTVVPGKKENIPTWGQASFSLELHFEVDHALYILTRSKSTAKVVERASGGDVLVANGNTPVTAYIEELLGLNAKDFNLFVQSKQGETSGVLTFGATALNNKVEEFAGISLIDEVKSRAQSLAISEKAAADAKAVSAEDIAEAEQQFLTAQKERDDAAESYEAAGVALDNYPALTSQKPSVSSETLRAVQRDAQRAESALREAEQVLSHKREALATAKQALAECGEPVEVDGIQAEVTEKTAVLRQKRARLADVQEEVAAGVRAEAEHEQALTVRNAIEPVTLELLEQHEKTHAHYAGEAARHRELIAVTKSKLASLRKLEKDATCPTCGTALAEHDPDALAEEIALLEKEISDLGVALSLDTAGEQEGAKTLAALRKRIDQRETKQVEVEKWAAKLVDSSVLSDLRGELVSLQGVIDELQGEIAGLKAKIESAEQTNERHASALRRLTKAETEVGSAEYAIEGLRPNLARHVPSDEDIALAVEAETAYAAAEQTWKEGKRSAEYALELAGQRLKTSEKEFARAGDLKKLLAGDSDKAREHAMKADKASRLARFLAEKRQSYLRDVWDTVLAAASRQVQVATRGTITRITNEGEFGFEEDGVVAPVASASGAQKAFIGSAVRIGLARALYGSDSLLIFDEPTESMSEKNASGLAASLTSAARQLLLITHREQDQNLAANIITVGV